MAEITLAAETGRVTGSRSSGRLRAAGKVPGTVYGLGTDPQSVAVVWRELRAALTTDAGLNALIDLSIDGAATDLVMVKEMQRHPIRRDVLHVDFLRVSRDQVITVDVPIVLVGEAKEVTDNDGTVDQVMHSLTIHAKPGAIPTDLELDISGLSIGHALRVGDLSLPAGVETAVDPEEPVVTGAAQAVEAPAEGEEAEGAEGEAAEGAEAEAGAEGEAEAGESGEGGE